MVVSGKKNSKERVEGKEVVNFTGLKISLIKLFDFLKYGYV